MKIVVVLQALNKTQLQYQTTDAAIGLYCVLSERRHRGTGRLPLPFPLPSSLSNFFPFSSPRRTVS